MGEVSIGADGVFWDANHAEIFGSCLVEHDAFHVDMAESIVAAVNDGCFEKEFVFIFSKKDTEHLKMCAFTFELESNLCGFEIPFFWCEDIGEVCVFFEHDGLIAQMIDEENFVGFGGDDHWSL